MLKINHLFPAIFLIIAAACSAPSTNNDLASSYPNFSGIYPHLAYYNEESECGTGAVVPWADRLWVITYGAHLPYGSSDKLYEITPDLQQIVRPESIGGTPANRMIHTESRQLFIGPYAISQSRDVRVIPYEQMPGRHTGNARHLTDPSGKIYYGTMEEGFYEVDVTTLEVNTLYVDGNVTRPPGEPLDTKLLLGAHGKGLYSGQGVMVYSNNGESGQRARDEFDIEAGSLYEWDGNEWKLVRRNQFVEVSGPGGIHGNKNPETDPIWATGWDHKSVLLGVRDADAGWEFFRLPKASHSYDGAHGWNTEWPRIRDVGTEQNPDYLMTMHGMFWRFPAGFTRTSTSGIRPRSAYLKVIGDFARWQDWVVFGADDSANKEFLNKRRAKGSLEGPGQSNSNLWFVAQDMLDRFGPATANAAVWLNEEVGAGISSEPVLFTGWDHITLWIQNQGSKSAQFTLQIDPSGKGEWQDYRSLDIRPGASEAITFGADEQAEWMRIIPKSATKATAHLAYVTQDNRGTQRDGLFAGVNKVGDQPATGALLYGLGDNRRKLGLAAKRMEDGKYVEAGYYELDASMVLERVEDPEMETFITTKFAIPEQVVTVEEGSVLVVDDRNRRWRLPLGDRKFDSWSMNGQMRICREVATERDLFNCHGTFYELPAENADGYAKIRPVASHDLLVTDYASYRGMLVISGVDPDMADSNPHVIRSKDKQLAVWAGVIDDLWKLGKPTGNGGPWVNSRVAKGVPSDPYLFGFYDKKRVELKHSAAKAVTFSILFEPVGHGPWLTWKEITVQPGETAHLEFPKGLEARWVRLVADSDCEATSWFTYD
ncbi:hypothetical protein ADIS_4243 [Lunatimonas lonarensis]|uniref:Uncharacterized protein n=1 Tax=Lunatimonas lonarensis TaxID=1232681 RepID=R7ZMK2_9BACT|nr:hypothetical protein [Lunatimonas lonarensis]EON75330.1 hypothetical protein ADIS_4243 [Lunatimonas lonarensis]